MIQEILRLQILLRFVNQLMEVLREMEILTTEQISLQIQITQAQVHRPIIQTQIILILQRRHHHHHQLIIQTRIIRVQTQARQHQHQLMLKEAPHLILHLQEAEAQVAEVQVADLLQHLHAAVVVEVFQGHADYFNLIFL